MSYLVDSRDGSRIWLNESEEVRNILQNVRMILSTPQGSVPMYRDFGIPWNFIDRPVPVAKGMIISSVREAVERWEPRVTVRKVITKDDPATPGRADVAVEVDINA